MKCSIRFEPIRSLLVLTKVPPPGSSDVSVRLDVLGKELVKGINLTLAAGRGIQCVALRWMGCGLWGRREEEQQAWMANRFKLCAWRMSASGGREVRLLRSVLFG